jgi:predicted phosphodiesterase
MDDSAVKAIVEYINIAGRLVNLGSIIAYVGHERSHDVLIDKARFNEFLQRLNQVCDGVSLICTGHTHHPFLVQRDHVNWINPGAVMVMPSTVTPGDGYNYALYNSANNEVVFCRIPVVQSSHKPLTVGIIADTDNISQLDDRFWSQLAKEFSERGAETIIMCGNHWGGDIGRPEFDGFNVYFNMLPHQADIGSVPSNWHRINPDFPVVDVMGFKLMVKYNFGDGLSQEAEYGSLQAAKELSHEYNNHHIDFVLCGQSQDALFEEGEGIIILCPGDSRNRRKFATVCLPRKEITFGAVRVAV